LCVVADILVVADVVADILVVADVVAVDNNLNAVRLYIICTNILDVGDKCRNVSFLVVEPIFLPFDVGLHK